MRSIESPRVRPRAARPAVRRCGSSHPVGFSLLELLVVVAILVVLSALAVPNVIDMAQRNRVAQAAESVREVVVRSRTFAIDAGIDYQFRYEPNGQNFVVLPMELEPASSNSTAGDTGVSNYDRLAGELSEGFRLAATADESQSIESLDVAWFGQLDNSLLLSQVSWSSPVIFRFDGTADDGEFQIATDEGLAVDFTIRGLTGAISVSRVYQEAD